ncbi:MAG: UDP-glucose dehydrogenase family protein, partial [Dehalococcoidia bacterium]
MTRIAVLGCGYVGAVSAACFAKLGHDVECIDLDPQRVRLLQGGRSPIHEPGLEELLAGGIAAGRLSFRASYPDRIDAQIVFIAVNTPESQEGAADIRAVRDAVSMVAPRLSPGSIIVNKSTVPIGTAELVAGMAHRAGNHGIAVVSNPEFLREGSAISDFLLPDRIVLGSDSADALDRVAALYAGIEAPVLRVDVRTAEMIKYASNAFLAVKIGFMNEIANLCDGVGADVHVVAKGMGLDKRIGSKFLHPGPGYGGSCFPKDTRALAALGDEHQAPQRIVTAAIDVNLRQRQLVVDRLAAALDGVQGREVAVLGLAFKPNTDDVRESPALYVCRALVTGGAHVRAFDPVASAPAAAALADIAAHLVFAASVEHAVADADAIVIMTEWNEFRGLDLAGVKALMRGRLIVDARNVLDPGHARALGFTY